MNQETFYAMALTRLTNFNFQQALALYKAAGSAQLLYEYRHNIGDIIEIVKPKIETSKPKTIELFYYFIIHN